MLQPAETHSNHVVTFKHSGRFMHSKKVIFARKILFLKKKTKKRDSLVYVCRILRLKMQSQCTSKKPERVLRSSSVAVPQRGCIQTRGILAVDVHCRHRLTSCRHVCDGCCSPITGTTRQPAVMKCQNLPVKMGNNWNNTCIWVGVWNVIFPRPNKWPLLTCFVL